MIQLNLYAGHEQSCRGRKWTYGHMGQGGSDQLGGQNCINTPPCVSQPAVGGCSTAQGVQFTVLRLPRGMERGRMEGAGVEGGPNGRDIRIYR